MIDSVAYVIYGAASGIIHFFIWIFSVPWLAWFWSLVGTCLLGYIAFKLWMHYIRQDFISGIDWVLLEIVPPRDVLRSPKAMELFISNALYHFSVKGGRETYWQGAVWFWFSLEIASIDGQVHFYVRTPSRLKEFIETQMYAQYPQAQVKVVDDYTLAVDEITPKSAWNLWGAEFKLVKHEAYPIKTYVDYGLDKDPKEEFKVDPISPVIELFGSLQKGEQMWLQIVVTPSKKEYRTKGSHFWQKHSKKYHDWVKESKNEIAKLLKPFTSVKDEGARIEIRVPDFYKKSVEGLAGKAHKLGFDTGIRVCYVAKKDVFKYNNRKNLRLIFRQYENPSINGFTRFNSTQADAYGGFFLASQKTIMMLANRMLHEYRNRSFFHPPLRHKLFNVRTIFWPFSALFKPYFHSETFVLNTEELATIWHFPGQILKVPTLERIESKEATPPPNLPI
ncbi:hypothetical protein KKA39_03095 [Patescibacteria group bacterium]|nr:hypothetical protein [Patescibacteria group bacterium]